MVTTPAPSKIQAPWSIRTGLRVARLEPQGLTLYTTNRRVTPWGQRMRSDRWGPVRWLVVDDTRGSVAKGEVYQTTRYSSLVREAMYLAEVAAHQLTSAK